MNLHDTAGWCKAYWARSLKLALMFVLLFTACFTGAAAAKAASSELIIVNKKTNKLGYFSGGKLEKIFRLQRAKRKA